MLYEALSGQLPFHGSNQSVLFRSIRRGAYAPLPKTISADARDLVKRLLAVDPAARITWDQLSRHPWLSGQAAQQHNRSSSAGAACSDGAGGSCTSSGSLLSQKNACSASGLGTSTHNSQRASMNNSEMLADESTMQAVPSGGSSCLSSFDGGCRWSLQPSFEGARAAAEGLDSSCEGQLPQRSAVSFTSASCHDSVRVVIAESSRGEWCCSSMAFGSACLQHVLGAKGRCMASSVVQAAGRLNQPDVCTPQAVLKVVLATSPKATHLPPPLTRAWGWAVASAPATDDPIAAAIKRLAGSSTVSSPQSSEEPKNILKDWAPTCTASKGSSSRGLSLRGLLSPCSPSPVRGRGPTGHQGT
eukprot:GHRQ01022998.1.p1 GENE.GHRQ01022998.1~~GHRQ01022998.1.p1  ORF type:complete len:359 (+),score=68.39 GHRQ01022998.1:1-1077(+)